MENGLSSTKAEGFLSRMALNDNKAGMEGLDRDKINKIIIESSKGSKFYENERKREQQLNQRIEKMMLQKAQITEHQLKKAQAQVERMAAELERSRDLSRVIVHVDMDAFYAAVEMRDCPELKDKPMAVGSMSMLSTSNYHARKYGVRAAMPGFIAKKLCPSLVIVPLNFDQYRAVSSEIREIFADYDPHFQPMSLDEAYLDFTEHLEKRQSWPESARTHRYRASCTTTGEEGDVTQQEAREMKDFSPVLFEDSPSSSTESEGVNTGGKFEVFGKSIEEAVREMRFRIEQRTMLTASAGIAPNTMLAKVCSDKNKPNGQYRLPPTREDVMDFIKSLPVRKVSGIGKVSEKMLNALSVTTCSDLHQQMRLLSLLFSETAWHHFLQVSMGLGSTYIPRHEERKSMSTERTFKELSKVEEQLSLCRELCEDLAADMKKEDLKGKTVTLKLKNVNFEVKSRAMTVPYAVATEDEIFAVAKDLLKTEIDNESPQPLRLRLMGVRISAFVSSDYKKPLQKSILGFLQPGKLDSSSSTRETNQKFEEKPNPNHSFQTQSLPCPPLVKKCQRQQEDPVWTKKRVLEGSLISNEPKQSFFQRAQAKRLKIQTENANKQEEEHSQDAAPVITSPDTSAHKLEESPTKEHEKISTASDLLENGSVSPLEAHASTSGCGSKLSESLTCPVCFRKVETTNLNIFNTHIDQCLHDSSRRPNQYTVSDSDSDLDMQTDQKGCEVVEKWSRECVIEAGKHSKTSVSNRDALWDNQHSPKEDSVQKTLLINSDIKTVTLQQPQSCNDKSSILICPICQLTQESDDLIIFNHHVDLCLNQEVLHELKGPTSSPINPLSVTNPKAVGRDHLLPTGANKGKTKRRDTPSSPSSKKAKGPGPINTIDKFFR